MSGSFIYGTGCFLSGGLCMNNEQASMDPFRIMAFTEAERERDLGSRAGGRDLYHS